MCWFSPGLSTPARAPYKVVLGNSRTPHAARRNLHHPLLPLLPGRQGAAEAGRASPSPRSTSARDPERRDRDDRAGERPHHGAADLHRRDACRRLRRPLRARATPASSTRCSTAEGKARMTGTGPSRPRLIQMRSGLRPPANLDAAVQPDRRGQGGRRRLRADAGDDQHHGGQARAAVRRHRRRRRTTPALATFRELARKLAIISMSARSRSRLSPDKAANRVVPDRPERRDRRALRQDPYVRRRSRRRRELSRVATTTGRASSPCSADLPWGRLGLTVCYDLRFPALYRALAEAGATLPCDPVRLHQADRRGALACADARARDRERLLRVRGRAGRQARERPRDLRPFADRRSLGPHPRRRRHRARRDHGGDRSGRSRRRARRASRRCSTAAASRSSSRWRSRRICMPCGARQ